MTSKYSPPHGRAILDGTVGLGARGLPTSLLTGEQVRPLRVGDVVFTKADERAAGGIVVDLEVDDMGEAQLLILSHNENPKRPSAWTVRLSGSDIDPAKTIPDHTNARHAYAKVCYSVCAAGLFVSRNDLRLAGIAAALVADVVREGS